MIFIIYLIKLQQNNQINLGETSVKFQNNIFF